MKNEKLSKCVMWLVSGVSNLYIMNHLNKKEKDSIEVCNILEEKIIGANFAKDK